MAQFERRFAEVDSLMKAASETHIAAYVAPIADQPSPIDTLIAAKAAHELHALRSETGLTLSGQVYARPETALHDADDDDDLSRYKGKGQAEVSWNWTHSQLYQPKAKKRQIALGAEWAKLQEEQRREATRHPQALQAAADRFNVFISQVVTLRMENLDILCNAYTRMLASQRISTDQLLNVMNDRMEAESQLASLGTPSPTLPKALARLRATHVAIDTIGLSEALRSHGTEAREATLKGAMADNEAKLTNYLATASLSPFARWQTYWNAKDHLNSSADVGIKFTLPLHDGSRQKRKALAKEKEIAQAEAEAATAATAAKCQAIAERIAKLNQAVATEGQHVEQLMRYVAYRQRAYEAQQRGYNYVGRMEELCQLLQSMERQAKLMQSRAVAVAELDKEAGLPEGIGQYIEEKDL